MVTVFALVAFSGVAAEADAHHSYPATYSGTIEGGGQLEFVVSGDGAAVTFYSVTEFPAAPCGTSASETFNGTIAISGDPHSFSSSYITGNFDSPQQTSGTYRYHFGSCTTPFRNWTASTSATSPPTLTVNVNGSGFGKVDSSPAGIDCPPTCMAEFVYNQPVTLTASPNQGSTFGGWSGCDVPSGASCTMNLGGDKSVTGTFEAIPAEDSTPPPPPDATPQPPSPPPPPLLSGTAITAGAAQVQGGRALLNLRCLGSGSCSGNLRLVTRIKLGKKSKSRGGGAKRSRRPARNLVIGRAGFAIAAGGSVTVPTPLTRQGKALFRKAGKRGLSVKLRGSGVVERPMWLKAGAPTCGVARRRARIAQGEFAQTKRALANARNGAARRGLRKQLSEKRGALRQAKRQQARVCGRQVKPPVSNPGAEPGPGAAPNHPPQFPSSVPTEAETQFHYDGVGHLDGATTTLKVLSPATDPDGDPVTYTWSATNGSIAGNGLSAAWERAIAFGQPAAGIAMITASDGKGGTDMFEFKFN